MTNHILLDPSAENHSAERQLLARPVNVEGLTIGLLDIAKAQGKEFLDQVEKRLVNLGATVKRYRKPTFTRIAPTELKQQISVECDVLIEGLAD